MGARRRTKVSLRERPGRSPTVEFQLTVSRVTLENVREAIVASKETWHQDVEATKRLHDFLYKTWEAISTIDALNRMEARE